MYTPDEILSISIENGQKKIQKPLVAKLILGFIGGAMISLGYLAYVRVSASIPADLASVQALVAVSTAWFAKKVSFRELLVNWVTITLANMVGALFVAYFFGHYLGLTSSGAYLNQVLSLAEHKVAATWLQAIISGIGCNWFVGLALWLCYGAKDAAGKLLGIWFPVMIFVAIGFQHSVANAFIIPAAIFEGGVQWGDFFRNFIFVYLGNIIGGAIFVSGFYYLSYRKH